MTLTAEGVYKAKIVSWMLSTASTGSDQFVVEVEVCGKHTGDTIEAISPISRMLYRTIANDQQANWLLSDLRAIGFNGTSFSQLSPGAENAFDFTSVEVWARCRHEVYQGRDREKWEWAREPRNALAAGALRALDDKFRVSLEAHRTKLADQSLTRNS